MAEGIFNKLCKEKGIEATSQSAGIMTCGKEDVSENSVTVCKEIEVDISSHKSVPIAEIALDDFDLICPMTVSHAQMLVSLGVKPEKICVLNVPDPFGGDVETYRQCRKEIEKALNELITKL